jgi:hypothetical protein
MAQVCRTQAAGPEGPMNRGRRTLRVQGRVRCDRSDERDPTGRGVPENAGGHHAISESRETRGIPLVQVSCKRWRRWLGSRQIQVGRAGTTTRRASAPAMARDQPGGDPMPSSTAARSGAATRKGQVPRPRGQQERKPERSEGSAQPAGSAERGGMPGVHLPGGTAGNVMWWGGLAAVAALGIVDWPVAALVAAGTWVAEQRVRRSEHPQAH